MINALILINLMVSDPFANGRISEESIFWHKIEPRYPPPTFAVKYNRVEVIV